MERIVLGLSGGVDSAVAARLLTDAGYEVTGVYLDIGGGDKDSVEKLARELGIGFECVSIERELEELVKRPFAEAYLKGETPNPCIMCNPAVKFPALITAADRLGIEKISTGHYARVSFNAETGRYLLLRGMPANDQSYMLCGLTQSQLGRLVLPLGEYDKSRVRELASSFGLTVAKKADSMEICFIPDNDYAAFIEKLCGTQPEGDFVDEAGKFVAKHRGIHHYTIGQRRGLNVAAGHRVFVSDIDPETNRVTLSEGSSLMADEAELEDVKWIAYEAPDADVRCEVRVRHSKLAFPAYVHANGESAVVMFDEPVRAPTPGQTAVFYAGDTVLGCGKIKKGEKDKKEG